MNMLKYKMNVLYSSVQYWCLKLSPYNLKKYFRKLTKVLINLHKMPRVLDLYDGALNEYRYALQDEFDQRTNMSRAYEDACRGLINYEKSTIKSSAEFNKIFEKIEKDYGVKKPQCLWTQDDHNDWFAESYDNYLCSGGDPYHNQSHEYYVDEIRREKFYDARKGF